MYALALLAYAAINPTAADHTITLTGRDLTIEQIVEVARFRSEERRVGKECW